MKNSPRNKDGAPSPSSIITITSITNPTRTDINRSETTTYVRTDAASFKQVVQMLTGSSNNPNPTRQQPAPSPRYSLPPLRPVPHKKHSSSPSTIFERRNYSNKHLKINPVRTGLPGRLSPSLLNIPGLALTSPNTPLVHDPFNRADSGLALTSPDTPLVHDPFNRAGSVTPSPSSEDVEEREIREKGFYLHPSPKSTTDPKPKLLLLFPLTSPRASDST